MSEFKTNKISPRSGTTQTIGDSGDSVSTSGGSTITNAGSITTAGITGGTITTSGDFKIHTFTGPGTFCVSQSRSTEEASSLFPPPPPPAITK